MLTKLEIRNVAGTLRTLVWDDVSDGYVLESVDGWDPVKATITSSSFANLDGVQFQNAKREARNIIISLKFEPDFAATTAWALRRGLYQWFSPKQQLSIRIFDSEAATVDIVGHVESFEAPLFVKKPGGVISIICEDPDLVELTPVTGSGNTVSTSTEFLVAYAASAETGIKFTLHLNRSLSAFTIYHRTPDNQIHSMEFNGALVNLDTLVINTNVGQKGATLTRAGVASSVLYGISNETWFRLQQGSNYFRFFASGAAIPFDYEFTRRHGGL